MIQNNYFKYFVFNNSQKFGDFCLTWEVFSSFIAFLNQKFLYKLFRSIILIVFQTFDLLIFWNRKINGLVLFKHKIRNRKHSKFNISLKLL
jgi:hypothetical protein